MKQFFYQFDLFWSRHPALLYSITSLTGFWAAISPSVYLFILFIAVLATCANSFSRFLWRAFLSCGIASTVFLLGTFYYQLPDIPAQGIEGTLYFEIDTLSTTEKHFGSQWIYEGKGKHFIPSHWSDLTYEGKNISCTLRLAKKKHVKRPLAVCSYVINGTLKKNRSGNYYFTPRKGTQWEKVKGSRSLAERRYAMKAMVSRFIVGKIPDSKSAKFLSGMITGQFEDRMLRAEFSRLGLQHIMAISGFHFALLSGIFALLIRWIAPPRIAVGSLIFLMTIYFVFLGASPSILRAWVMCMVGLASVFAEKRSVSLNALGVAILFIILYDPLLTRSIGFQFSCAVTGSILIFYPLTRQLIDLIIASRPLAMMKKMSRMDQHLYCVLGVLKGVLALGIAVNIIALPMTLFFFQKFPLSSLLYNLFIPFLVCCCIFLFVISTIIYLFVPLIGDLLFDLTSRFTHFFLNFIFQSPISLHVYWKIDHFSSSVFLSYMTGVFLCGILLKMKLDQERNLEKDLIL